MGELVSLIFDEGKKHEWQSFLTFAFTFIECCKKNFCSYLTLSLSLFFLSFFLSFFHSFFLSFFHSFFLSFILSFFLIFFLSSFSLSLCICVCLCSLFLFLLTEFYFYCPFKLALAIIWSISLLPLNPPKQRFFYRFKFCYFLSLEDRVALLLWHLGLVLRASNDC